MITRREMLAGVGGVAAAAALDRLGAQVFGAAGTGSVAMRPLGAAPDFPRKADFHIAEGYTYINGAYTHPMPIVSVEAARTAADGRSTLGPPAPRGAGGRGGGGGPRGDPKTLFATLINAKPGEIAYVPNTSTGE